MVPHRPVLLQEVLAALEPKDDSVMVDGTFGAGGYTKALLEAARCVVYAIDRDPDAIAAGQELVRRFPGRLILLQGRFAEMDQLLQSNGLASVDGVALDIGVSSMQLDQMERGFSFREDGPLDMRMERSGPSAADLVNQMSESELADVIYQLGEEHASRRIARAIVRARSETPILRTAQLAAIVAQVVRPGPGIHPATRTFQALRIYVNDELEQLRQGLAAAERLLKPGGRLAVVSFHSLEDRLVKQFLLRRTGDAPQPSRHAPAATAPSAAGQWVAPSFRLLRRGAVKPGSAETAANPRARSARLRAAERTAAPAIPLVEAA